MYRVRPCLQLESTETHYTLNVNKIRSSISIPLSSEINFECNNPLLINWITVSQVFECSFSIRMFRNRRNTDRSVNNDGKSDPLILPNSKIKFSQDQLHNLNYIFNKRLQYHSSNTDSSFHRAKSIAERLIQRLLCAAGSADPRFASKFLVDNNPESNYKTSRKTLSFLVRLDELSYPPLYELDSPTKLEIIENDSDCPPSYCRIRLPPSKMKKWNEFINPNGFLRRDKVQTRLVKLLAEAAEKDGPMPQGSVDESIVCGIPGKIVDAATLHQIFRIPSFEQLYYGPGGDAPGFPDPSDFRIAIVDEPQGILLRLEFLSPNFDNICFDVNLLLAIGVDKWPSSSNFPKRIPLVHPDCLLYHMAAETGMFLVGFGVQSSAWQMRLPAAEYTILNHYGLTSTVRIILDILKISEIEIDMPRRLKQYQLSYKILNKYILLTALFDELERDSRKPLTDSVNWCSKYVSKIVLTILDDLIFNLTKQKLPNYFFEQSNLMVNPGHLSEDDYLIEANNVKMYIYKLYDESLQNFSSDEEYKTMARARENEVHLLLKWTDLIEGMLPQVNPRNEGFCLMKSSKRKTSDHNNYSRYQLEYISIVLRSILTVRRKILKSEVSPVQNSDTFMKEPLIEDVIYLTKFLMEEAKNIYSNKCKKHDKKQSKIENRYSLYTSKFIDLMREDPTVKSSNLEDDLVVVNTVINLLHKAFDFEDKHIGRILQPYLRDLFEISFAISWHLEDIKGRMNDEELKSLGCFCKLVNSGEITPAQGLLDASRKKWKWAEDILEMTRVHAIKIVLIPDREQVNQYVVYPEDNTNLDSTHRRISKRKVNPLDKNYFNTFISKDLDEDSIPQHELLKIKSPLTSVMTKMHRKGLHRGCGDTFMSLIHMRKTSVFQEITSTMSEEEKTNLNEIMHNLLEVKNTNNREKNWTNTLPKVNKNVSFSPKDGFQTYKPMLESAGVRNEDIPKDPPGYDTLIRKCRTLRMKENRVYFHLVEDRRPKEC